MKITNKKEPLGLNGGILSYEASDATLLGPVDSWVRSGEMYGGGRDAAFVAEIFPLEMT